MAAQTPSHPLHRLQNCLIRNWVAVGTKLRRAN